VYWKIDKKKDMFRVSKGLNFS